MAKKAFYYLLSVTLFFVGVNTFGQGKLPNYLIENKKFSASLKKIIKDAGLDSTYNVGDDGTEQISFAVIDLNGKRPVFGGVNYSNFIYPASLYKIYMAMEVLKQISEGKHSLNEMYIIHSPNDVDRSREISFDPRPLLKDGDTLTINYLLDLMITRSDNSAANCLIDIAKRENINNTMRIYGWAGSEVTRKFLKRKFEDPGYDTIRGTETNALHAADFMYKVFTNQLINPWVSMQMKALLGRQLDATKISTGLPPSAMFFHKTGWWSYYTDDVGIVENGGVKYIISLFIPLSEELARTKFEYVSKKVWELMEKRWFK